MIRQPYSPIAHGTVCHSPPKQKGHRIVDRLSGLRLPTPAATFPPQLHSGIFPNLSVNSNTIRGGEWVISLCWPLRLSSGPGPHRGNGPKFTPIAPPCRIPAGDEPIDRQFERERCQAKRPSAGTWERRTTFSDTSRNAKTPGRSHRRASQFSDSCSFEGSIPDCEPGR